MFQFDSLLVCLSVVRSFVCLFATSFVCLSVCRFVCLFACLLCLSVCRFVCLFVCLLAWFVCLFVCLFIWAICDFIILKAHACDWSICWPRKTCIFLKYFYLSTGFLSLTNTTEERAFPVDVTTRGQQLDITSRECDFFEGQLHKAMPVSLLAKAPSFVKRKSLC